MKLNQYLKAIKNSGIKPFDVLVLLLLFALGSTMLISNIVFRPNANISKLYVVVTKDSKEIRRVELSKNTMIKVDDLSLIQIKDGAAKVLEAKCRDQICVHTTQISLPGEMIVCLPNRIIVMIEEVD